MRLLRPLPRPLARAPLGARAGRVGGADGSPRAAGLVLLSGGPGGGPRALRLLGPVARDLLPRRQDRLLGRPDDADRDRLRDPRGRPAADGPPRLHGVRPAGEPGHGGPLLRPPRLLLLARPGDRPDRGPRHDRGPAPRPRHPHLLGRAPRDAGARRAARALPESPASARRARAPGGPDAAGLGLRPRDAAQRPDDARGPGPRGRAGRRATRPRLPRGGAPRRDHDAELDHRRRRGGARGEPDGPPGRARDPGAGPDPRGPRGHPDGPARGGRPRARDAPAHRRPHHRGSPRGPHRRPLRPRPGGPPGGRAGGDGRRDRGPRPARPPPRPRRPPASRPTCARSPSSRATPRRSWPKRRQPRAGRPPPASARSASCATCTPSSRRSRR